MGFKFEFRTVDGDEAGSFETAVPNWQTGDTLIASGNVRYRVTAVLPLGRIAEFVDRPLNRVLEASRSNSRCERQRSGNGGRSPELSKQRPA